MLRSLRARRRKCSWVAVLERSIAASRKDSLVDASGPGPLVGGAAYLVPAAGGDDATRPSLVADAEETVADRRRRLSIDEEEPWEEEPARK